MAKQINKNIVCPNCCKEYESNLWRSVNVSTNPELRKSILCESLFKWCCPECAYEGQLSYPILYNDPKNKFMIYYTPEISKLDLEKKVTEKQFPELTNINKRVVDSLNLLKEKIFIFELGLNDVAVELTKLALSNVIKEKYNISLISGYFYDMDKEAETMSFTFFLDETGTPYQKNARLGVYKKSLDIVKNSFKDKPDHFIKVDQDLAKQTLKTYRLSQTN